MKKVLLQFSYDGSKFNGFQRQNNARSVQGDIEKALSTIYDRKIVIKGAGRTDRGVHALNQYAHVDGIEIKKNLKANLNALLSDCVIKKVKYVNDDFHARYSVKKKTYEYIISFNKEDDSRYYLIYYKDLDINKMKEASKVFIGTHNFKNFVSGERDDYETTIFDIKFKFKKNRLHIYFTGIGFYRYMIRNLVGALVDVGKGSVDISALKDMLINYEVRKQLSTVKSEGLYLVDIKY